MLTTLPKSGSIASLPPGIWAIVEHVVESPHGRVWCEAIGLTPGSTRAEWEQLPEVFRRRGLFVTLDEPTQIAPGNGPSYVGRLGGGGDHPAAAAPQGDPLAMFLLTGIFPVQGTQMERALVAKRLRSCDSQHSPWGAERAAAVAAVPPTDEELEALHAAEAAADVAAESAVAAYYAAHEKGGSRARQTERLCDAATTAREKAVAARDARRAGQLAYQAGRVKDARRAMYEAAGLAYPA